MKLKISGAFPRLEVSDAETGARLEGVRDVRFDTLLGKFTLTLEHGAIDVSIDSSRVEAVTHEDGKYARTKLLDVARLRWRS